MLLNFFFSNLNDFDDDKKNVKNSLFEINFVVMISFRQKQQKLNHTMIHKKNKIKTITKTQKWKKKHQHIKFIKKQ